MPRLNSMSRLKYSLGCLILIIVSACTTNISSAQTDAVDVEAAAPINYTFTEVNFKGDTFTQLLGVNKNGVVAGYHGSGLDVKNPNKGFTWFKGTFTAQNFPKSAQTQVIGINDALDTAGFYIDSKGVTHGFHQTKGTFHTHDFPGTTFNQLLSFNNQNQAAGYSQDGAGNFHPYYWNESGPYLSLLIPRVVSAQATGINLSGSISGFYIDSAAVNHGFLFTAGSFQILNYPSSTFTQALGVNDLNQVVGTYIDGSNNQHGFTWSAKAGFHSIDDPNGIGTTVTNGINNLGEIVGFWGDTAAGISHGFVALP